MCLQLNIMHHILRGLFMTVALFITWFYLCSPEIKYSPSLPSGEKEIQLSNLNRKEINILFWRPQVGRYRYPLYSSDERCQFHFNQSDYNNSEAVIFQDFVLKEIFPSYRPRGQRWLYQAWQSSHRTRLKKYLQHVNIPEFNYTLTYSRHSDVYLPYGECVNLSVTNPEVVKQHIDDIVDKKQKLAAWMVSHCITAGLREVYVRELSQHMDVDIYGDCGKLFCINDDMCQKTMSKYKFYLAFENALCGEYITEKLWRSFEWGLVPVVFGGLDAYKLILPSNSYIDVTDFSSPKLLADYMNELNSNETLYRSYFNWKYTYQCGNLSTKHKMNRICTFLQKNKQQVVDMKHVWNCYTNRCEQQNRTRYLAGLGVTVNEK